MIEVKGSNQTSDSEVLEKANAAIRWCECATKVDIDNKLWEFKLIADKNIVIGNSIEYTIGMSEKLEV